MIVARQEMAIRRVQKDDRPCFAAGAVSTILEAEDPLTRAMKRYRASVSMNTGASADSPSASRSLLMAAFRL